MELRVAVTTTGSAGSATGSTDSDVPVRGYILGIQLDYHASAPATTDVTITELAPDEGTDRRTVLSISNNATDGFYYPAVEVQDNAGTGQGSYWPYFISNRKLQVSVAQSDALTDAVVATIIVDQEQ